MQSSWIYLLNWGVLGHIPLLRRWNVPHHVIQKVHRKSGIPHRFESQRMSACTWVRLWRGQLLPWRHSATALLFQYDVAGGTPASHPVTSHLRHGVFNTHQIKTYLLESTVKLRNTYGKLTLNWVQHELAPISTFKVSPELSLSHASLDRPSDPLRTHMHVKGHSSFMYHIYL